LLSFSSSLVAAQVRLELVMAALVVVAQAVIVLPLLVRTLVVVLRQKVFLRLLLEILSLSLLVLAHQRHQRQTASREATACLGQSPALAVVADRNHQAQLGKVAQVAAVRKLLVAVRLERQIKVSLVETPLSVVVVVVVLALLARMGLATMVGLAVQVSHHLLLAHLSLVAAVAAAVRKTAELLVVLAVQVAAVLAHFHHQTELLEVLTLVAAAVVPVVAVLVLAVLALSSFATKELQRSHLSVQV
jgi:hypothetical protein